MLKIMEFDGRSELGAYYLGSAEIPFQGKGNVDNMVAEALRQVLPFIGSGADELTDTGYTYRELDAILKRQIH